MSRVCWGCDGPREDPESDYCQVCQVSAKLIRKVQEDGTKEVWTIPEMRGIRSLGPPESNGSP